MLSIKSFNMLDALLLLGAADTVLAQLCLHLLQLKLCLKEFLIIGSPGILSTSTLR